MSEQMFLGHVMRVLSEFIHPLALYPYLSAYPTLQKVVVLVWCGARQCEIQSRE